jgi:hypothetical protein
VERIRCAELDAPRWVNNTIGGYSHNLQSAIAAVRRTLPARYRNVRLRPNTQHSEQGPCGSEELGEHSFAIGNHHTLKTPQNESVGNSIGCCECCQAVNGRAVVEEKCAIIASRD